MDLFRASERLMAMTGEDWARHANPASVVTRILILPALALTILARDWLGAWTLVPLALVVAWVWLNPRVFPRPTRADGWATEGVLGERVFLARHDRAIPAHHLRWAHGLTAASLAGLVPLVWGLWSLVPGWTLAGLVLTMGAKLWFVDRMVWLWRDMAATHPDVAAMKAAVLRA